MPDQPAFRVERQLKVEWRPIESLAPYAHNARKHPNKQLALLGSSITRFEFIAPALIAPNGEIIAGHGRVEAARALGMTAVPTIVIGHLTDAERRAYIIADNRLAQLADWDRKVLAGELQGLAALDLDFELELTGFDGVDLDELLGVDVSTGIDPEADRVLEPIGPPVTRPGDVWILGKHRLACGDARDAGAYGVLMPGEHARMVFTDPPYNVRVVGNVRR